MSRIRAFLKRKKLINELINEAKIAKHNSFIWSNPYEYGRDINNQWVTIWAMYPLMSDDLISTKTKKNIQKSLDSLIQSHISAATDNTSPLPAEIDSKNFQGNGEYIFSTALTPLIFLVKENYGYFSEEKNNYLKESLNRLIINYDKMIINPSKIFDDNDTSLEGYFAWAAICTTASAFGIKIDKTFTNLVIKSVELINNIEINNLENILIESKIVEILKKYHIFSDKAIDNLKISILNILKYKIYVEDEIKAS